MSEPDTDTPPTIADIIREAAMLVPAFKAGYDAMPAWKAQPGYYERDYTDDDAVHRYPPSPYPDGATEAQTWRLGAEQAYLEDGSADSWRDGGGGIEGVLRATPMDHMVGEVLAVVRAGRVLGVDALALLAAEVERWEAAQAGRAR